MLSVSLKPLFILFFAILVLSTPADASPNLPTLKLISSYRTSHSSHLSPPQSSALNLYESLVKQNSQSRLPELRLAIKAAFPPDDATYLLTGKFPISELRKKAPDSDSPCQCSTESNTCQKGTRCRTGHKCKRRKACSVWGCSCRCGCGHDGRYPCNGMCYEWVLSIRIEVTRVHPL
jgi:hypothetical protein